MRFYSDRRSPILEETPMLLMEEEVKLWIPVLDQEMELSKLELKVGNYFF